jgi:hypothetical protein
MGRAGIEPATPGFSVLCADDAKPNIHRGLRQAPPPPAAQGKRPASTPTPDLARVIDAWPALPDPIKAAVLALVNAAATLPTARAGASLSQPRDP